MKKGKFIVFEGLDGSGKSTHARLLKDNLNARGIEVYCTFEPTDYENGEIITALFIGRSQGRRAYYCRFIYGGQNGTSFE